MSRFNKNGQNLSPAQEKRWLDANTLPKAEETPSTEAPAEVEASTPQQPDEGTKTEAESTGAEKPRRGRRRRNKKGE